MLEPNEAILRIPGWQRITGSGLVFLFGFSLPTPYLPLLLGIAVHLYKDAFHCCFNFNLIPVVFLSLCYCTARMFLVRHFCYWSSVCPLITPPPFCCPRLKLSWSCSQWCSLLTNMIHLLMLKDPTNNKWWLRGLDALWIWIVVCSSCCDHPCNSHSRLAEPLLDRRP